MKKSRITAEVISCPGELGNNTFTALQLNVEGFHSPYVLTLSLRAHGYKALSEQIDPEAVFRALAYVVNEALVTVQARPAHDRADIMKGEAECVRQNGQHHAAAGAP